MSTILELYFGIFDNYETVIEHRLEAKKKNIINQEIIRLEKKYKEMNERLMRKTPLVQKKKKHDSPKVKQEIYNPTKKPVKKNHQLQNKIHRKSFSPKKSNTYRLSQFRKKQSKKNVKEEI